MLIVIHYLPHMEKQAQTNKFVRATVADPKLSPWQYMMITIPMRAIRPLIRSNLWGLSYRLAIPNDREDYKYTTLGGIYTAKVCGLECWYNSIDNQHDCSG